MHIKLIHPDRDGLKVYHNKGTAHRLVAYLRHEEKEKTTFFSESKNEQTPSEVLSGLKASKSHYSPQETRFHSLVLSPSSHELIHIKGSREALLAYSRQVMERYAQNFTFKDGKKLSSRDLLWYATIHQQRKNQQAEEQVKQPYSLQQHVHILVAGKDQSGKLLLNPHTKKSRFSLLRFQSDAMQDFEKMFDYKQMARQTYQHTFHKKENPQLQQKLMQAVEKLNDKVGQVKLDSEKILQIGNDKQYSHVFFTNFHRLQARIREGKYPEDPYFFLSRGRDPKAGENPGFLSSASLPEGLEKPSAKDLQPKAFNMLALLNIRLNSGGGLVKECWQKEKNIQDKNTDKQKLHGEGFTF